MKKIVLSLFLAFLWMISSSQEKPSFISLNTGASIPVGGFHKTELPDGGFAETGINVALEGAWFFKPWLGVGAEATVDFHPVDVGSLGYEVMNENPFLEALIIRSDPYRTIGAYAGAYFNIPLKWELSFTAKALGGMIYASTPYQLYKAKYYMLGDKWYEITSAGDFEGSFLAGAGLRYDLNEAVAFALNGEFTYNQADFNFTTATGVRTDVKVISFVNVGFGVIWRIVASRQ